MKFNLRSKLLSTIIILCIFSSIVFAAISYYQLQDYFIREKQDILEYNVALISILLDSWSSRALLAAETISLSVTHLIEDPNQLTTYLGNLKDLWEVDDIFWVNPDGSTSINTAHSYFNIADRQYFQTAIAGTPAHSGAIVSRATNTTAVAAAAPVRGENGAILGTIVVTMDLDDGSSSFIGLTTYESEDTYIIDSEGLFLTSSRLQPDSKLSTVIDTNALIAFQSQPFGSGVYPDYRDTDVVGSWMLSDNGWAVVTEIDRAEIMAPLNNLSLLLLGILFAIIVLASLVATYISGSITKPLHKLVTSAKHIASGDLSLKQKVTIGARDEIGELADAFNTMLENMRSLLGSVKDSSNKLLQKAEDISVSSSQVAVTNSEQANIAQEVTRAINELSKATEEIANNSDAVNMAGTTAFQDAQKSSQSIKSSIGTMEEIRNAVGDLGRSSSRIGQIINVIDDIADQTNLLALNAAIEAARAGEHGKSFTVVAEAVRSLAEKSSSSTKEIASLVQVTQDQIETAIKTTEVGADRANTAIAALNNIVSLLENIVQQVGGISAAGTQQAATAQEITASMETLSAASQEVSASSQEMASSSAVFKNMSGELEVLVAQFKNI